jgi:hypothetical protein
MEVKKVSMSCMVNVNPGEKVEPGLKSPVHNVAY